MFDSFVYCLFCLLGMQLYLYFLFVLGIRGKGYKGDIVIDDFSIVFKLSCSVYNGLLLVVGFIVVFVIIVVFNNCLVFQFVCVSDGKCIQFGQVCDFNLDCVDGFDERFCCKCYNIICFGGFCFFSSYVILVE